MKPPWITFVYAYYDNPTMLLRQQEEWLSYPDSVLKRLEIIITDDCSTNHPITEVFPLSSKLNIRVFRITKKVQWNWLACRNIGAHCAQGTWLLLTDMDHMLQKKHADQLFGAMKKDRLPSKCVYLFTRVDAPDNVVVKNHNDSFLMKKDLFWKIGGYDEELSGNYGTSGTYRRRAFKVAGDHTVLDIPLTRYSREVIPDASTTEFLRKEGCDKKAMQNKVDAKKLEGRKFWVLTFPYEELKW